MSEQWCKCRIVEPRIYQKGDALICEFCHERKELPPKADFKWAQLKKQLLAGGRVEYETLSKEGLINLLLKRDEMLLDKWHVPLDRIDYLDPRAVKGSLQEAMKKEIADHIHYITWTEGAKQ